MKNIYLVLVFFSVFHLTFGQSEVEISTKWVNSSCKIGNLQTDKSGNIIAAGHFNSALGGTDSLYFNTKSYSLGSNTGIYIMKLNVQKKVVWLKSIQSNFLYGYSAPNTLIDDSSNVYITGKFKGILKFDDKNILESFTGDNFLAKYTADGKLKWAKKYVGSSDNGAFIPEIDNQGNLYFIGRYQNSLEIEGEQILKAANDNTESYLLKLDSNGKFVMAKAFDKNFELNAISLTKNGEFFIAGNFQENVVLDKKKIKSSGLKDILYAKYDKNGLLLWVKNIAGKQDEDCQHIKTDDFGNIYIAGVASNEAKFDSLTINLKTASGLNIFLLEADGRTGQIKWLRNLIYGRTYIRGGSLLKFLHLNKKGEPFISGVVNDFLSENNGEKLNKKYDIGIEFLIKYDSSGKIAYFKEYPMQFNSYSLVVWNSMLLDLQGNVVISANTTILESRIVSSPANAILKIYTDLNDKSCESKEIPIERDNTNILSISESIIDNKKFNYQWYKNGEYISNANNVTFQAKEVGYYSLKLINKNNSSCQISSSNSIPIFPLTSNFPVILTVSNSAQSTLDIFSSSALSQKTEWYLDNKLLVNNNFFYVYTADGTYKVKQYFANGVVKESNEVNVNDGIAFGITKSTTYDDGDICKPMPNLIATVGKLTLQNENLKYQWYLNGNAVKDSTFNHFRAIVSGEYYVTIFVPSLNKTYTTGKYKTVAEDFPKSLAITKIEDICGAKALLKVDDSFIQRYGFESILWRVDDKVIPEATQPFYNANKSGFYTFSVQYKENTIGKTCTYNSFINFEKKNDFKLNLGYAYAGSGCVVDSFKVFTEQNPKYTYTWTKNDVPIEKQATNEIFVKDKARYKGIVRRNDGCVNETDEISLKGCTSDEDEKFLLLNPPPITADKTRFFNNEKALLSFQGCSNVNFQWLKNDQIILGANQENLEVKDGGNYALQIEKLGCKATTNSIKISVETILAVGEEKNDFNIEVYPNPTEEKIFVSIPPQINIPIDVKMTDISGKLISNYDFSASNSQFIDLKSLQVGVYLLVFDVQGKRVVKKIIKNN